VREPYAGNILDRNLLDQIAAHHEIGAVFHLAALLSTRGERDPELAHQINVEGTLHLLRMAHSRRSASVGPCASSSQRRSRCTA
jgi:threonine 3-dehydrogenase